MRIWQRFHSTELRSCQKADKKEEKQDLAFLLMQKLFSPGLFLIK